MWGAPRLTNEARGARHARAEPRARTIQLDGQGARAHRQSGKQPVFQTKTMKLKIDNLDGAGLRDYSEFVRETPTPRIRRRLNRPSEFEATLVSSTPGFLVPAEGARVVVERGDTGNKLFTGYLRETPQFEYAGWGEGGPVYRYRLRALSDEYVLDRKVLPARAALTGRSAGEVLKQITEDVMPGKFDLSKVENLDVIPGFGIRPAKSWSEHAGEVALLARGSYRAHNGAMLLRSLGARSYVLREGEAGWEPREVKITRAGIEANDVLVLGQTEPQAHVKAYFMGDGVKLSFDLPETPFQSYSQTLLEEEYGEATLRATRWSVADPAGAVGVSGGKLTVNGGTGIDGQTVVRFAEKLELGGALTLQHGDLSFSAESAGVLGGLYAGTVTAGGCLAGFEISKAGGQCAIRALVNGAATGATITTQPGHRYGLTTRVHASEIYRQEQRFHSSRSRTGGGAIVGSVRIVLEAHEIDPGDPATLVAAATVLYDGVVTGAPGYCTYALVNAGELHCGMAFTRIARGAAAEVRSALPGHSYRTRLTGSLSEGAECRLLSTGIYFFPQYAPAAGEKIEVRYRSTGRALARVADAESMAAEQRAGDDGRRGVVKRVTLPAARTSVDCEKAALMLLEDGVEARISGECQGWSDALPGGAEDCFPGDGLELEMPSRGMSAATIVREVGIELIKPSEERSRYTIVFANDSSEPGGFSFENASGPAGEVKALAKEEVGANCIGDLAGAEVTDVSSTQITMDMGCGAPAGGGFEARRSDYGWGAENDRNLAGRFSTRTFTLARLARAQEYYVRQYDGGSPRRYSRHSTLLRVDYPL